MHTGFVCKESYNVGYIHRSWSKQIHVVATTQTVAVHARRRGWLPTGHEALLSPHRGTMGALLPLVSMRARIPRKYSKAPQRPGEKGHCDGGGWWSLRLTLEGGGGRTVLMAEVMLPSVDGVHEIDVIIAIGQSA